MGVVYLAEDETLERRVALKVLPAELCGDAGRRRRFEREAKLLAAMNHPNIATIHTLEHDGDAYFLTMELVEGESLATRLARGALGTDTALAVARNIARALEAAHEKGVVHRDLKPPNVVFTAEGGVKVLDFGLATSIGRDAASSRSGRGQGAARLDEILASGIVGTPGYMSPEQLRGGVDPRIDIFAFGCVIYECLTARKAFGGDTVEERLEATMSAEPNLDLLPPETPGRIRELIGSCLAKPIDARPSSMTDARRTVEEVIEARTLERLMGGRAGTDVVTSGRSGHEHNLPRRLTTFIGRRRELTEIEDLLRERALVSIAGVGGSGKTRLALEVAQRRVTQHRDGVWFVELASIASPAHVPDAVMTALGLKEQPSKTAIETLVDHVENKHLLLVLDNCEHVLDAARDLSTRLLDRCPDARILATSREILGIDGEAIHVVPTLSTPAAGEGSSLDVMRSSEAVELFVDRARAIDPGFTLTGDNAATIAEICRRLDGIPLALELAAARTRVLSVDEISSRLDQRFKILDRGTPSALPRHRTLRGLIEWSYELLDEREQMIFRRLAVFGGGWTLEAAEAVCAGDELEGWECLDLLTCLIEKSLVERVEDPDRHGGRSRYRMLETVKEYAAERLSDAGEAEAARERHREYFLWLSRKADRNLDGPDQKAWLLRLTADDENLRLALEYAERAPAAECGLMIAGSLLQYWGLRGQYTAGRAACARILAHPAANVATRERACALDTAGVLAWMQGDSASARSHHERSLEDFDRIGERPGVARALNCLADVARSMGDYRTARTRHEESLSIARELGNRRRMIAALVGLGNVALEQHDYASSKTFNEEALSMLRDIGDRWGMAVALMNLGNVASCRGDRAKARECYDESLGIHRDLGNRAGTMLVLLNLGHLILDQGDERATIDAFTQALAIARELGDRRCEAAALEGLAATAAHAGDLRTAETYYGQGLTIQREIGAAGSVARVLGSIGVVAARLDQPVRAARLLGAAKAHTEALEAESVDDAKGETEEAAKRARAALCDEPFEREWTAGSAMTVEEAIAYALRESDPDA